MQDLSLAHVCVKMSVVILYMGIQAPKSSYGLHGHCSHMYLSLNMHDEKEWDKETKHV